MLATAPLVEEVAALLRGRVRAPVVVDPVMVATSGARLLEEGAVDAVRRLLLPVAAVVTPNGPEAALLAGIEVRDERDAAEAGRRLVGMGARAALVKGGHGQGDTSVDILVEADGRVSRFEGPRVRTTSTHGTGCTLSAAVAACLARGVDLRAAAAAARDYVQRALEAAPGLGGGHGPVNHLVPGWPPAAGGDA
jgi:hydroxymethylpyrimidine/phosphomethylpyrimidine kinase